MIELARVTKQFGGTDGVHAVEDVSLTIPEGSIVAFVGPSGCGKSTLLHMIAGLYLPTSGAVVYDGRVVRDVNPDVGYMTQRDNLFPWFSVRDNVAIPLECAGVARAERRARAGEVLRRVSLDGFEERYPSELSGGMRKRTALARMLLYAPKTFLLDEPFAALDPQLKLAMHELLLDIWREGRQTMVLVTHDLGEAITLASRVIVLSKRPAQVLREAKIDLPYPRDVRGLRYTPEFRRLNDELWECLQPEYVEERV